jgi:hypothetical protein
MDNDQEQEQQVEPQDEVSSWAGLASQSLGPRPETRAQQNVSMGFSPWAHIGNNPQAKAYWQNVNSQQVAQSRQKAPDPRSKDAQFYAGIGDFGAVETIMKSKGSSLFQNNESFDLEEMDAQGKVSKKSYFITPKGEYNINGTKVPLSMLSKRAGVGVVPFKSGDMSATAYRGLMSKVQKFHRDLNRLQTLYSQNAYLGSLDPSNASAEARALESNIKVDYLGIMKDTKGMGGNVSDNDMLLAEYMVPQRASNAFTRLGGNEMKILEMARKSSMDKIFEVGASNGLQIDAPRSGGSRANSFLEQGTRETSIPR